MAPLRRFLHAYVADRTVFEHEIEEEHQEAEARKQSMKRVLNLFDLTMMGVAAIVGAGIFVLTGVQARNTAGPAVILSYLMAGVVAMIVALCYAEFATEVSVTGGTFVYTTRLYGRAIGWFIAVNVLIEYILMAATVSIGCSQYFATLIGLRADFFRVHTGAAYALNPLAAGIVLLIMLGLILGVKETFWVNSATVIVSVLCIFITIGAGASKISPENYTPFLPYGFSGSVSAASSVFFAYVGFDMIAQGAEESANPRRDVPMAVITSTGFCTLLYMAVSAVIVGMVHYTQISVAAPFADAFRQTPGYGWASYVVSVGAVAGTFNTVLVTLFSLQRICVVLGRTDLLPRILGRVNPRTKTPIVSCVVTGLLCAVLAFCVPLETLADAVSMGTLVAFSAVCLGVAWRARYTGPGCGTPVWKVVLPSALVYASSLGFGLSYSLSNGASRAWPAWLAFFLAWVASTSLFHLAPTTYRPPSFAVPLNPWVPSIGVLFSVFLIAQLPRMTWMIWGFAVGIGMLVYVARGVVLYHRGWVGSAPALPDVAPAIDSGTPALGKDVDFMAVAADPPGQQQKQLGKDVAAL